MAIKLLQNLKENLLLKHIHVNNGVRQRIYSVDIQVGPRNESNI